MTPIARRARRGPAPLRRSQVRREAPSDPDGSEMACMEAKVVLDEARDEEIAVIVTFPHPEFERHVPPTAGLFQELRLELSFQERIPGPLIDQERRSAPAPILDQRRRIIRAPRAMVASEIAAQRLLAPWATHRRTDRREGRDGPVAIGMLECERKRAVAAHRVAENSGSSTVDWKAPPDRPGQLVGHVRVHPVGARPGRLGRIDVEAGTKAEVVARVFSRDTRPSRARIGHDEREAQLRRDPLRAGLDDEVLLCAGQAGEPIENGYGAPAGLRREKDAEA